MAITPADLGGTDDVARRVLVLARSIAPCIDSWEPTSEVGKDAIAVLKGVIAELPAPGSARVRAQARNGTSVSLADMRSAFSTDARESLRSLCGCGGGGLPAGSFPSERPFSRLWPETGDR